ncbi:ThuA domain-containing protein [Arundinibacter roseus]|uniref:ThuA domain-containing protein n=1 Tax=Arundinibacter roseus TaxID=2070510 RepID=A0A4R4K4I7_9BACT|nr:ThuA domain-containing protein [Arundinibacter roseus]TDB62270.1 ThuA domain-containing protein [Arundinibacter roseus]
MKKLQILLAVGALWLSGNRTQAQALEKVELSEAWKEKIEKLAPEKTTFPSKKKHKILVFSLFTGFNHWVVPHTSAMIDILGTKSGAFEVVQSDDIRMFEKNTLKKFDAVVLNNNCSINPRRDLFYDKLIENKTMTEAEATAKSNELQQNLLNYVRKGGGLLTLHGGVTMLNKSEDFSEMVGGSFDYHPTQQPLNVKLADPTHPLVKAFDGEGFSHIDEAYMFNMAYKNLNFHPLMYLKTSEIKGLKGENPEDKKYIAWIKRYGKGRVMYASPSHNAQSFENPKLLRFFLDGMQYVVGDVACDETPLGTAAQMP